MDQSTFGASLKDFTQVLSSGVFTQQGQECSIDFAVNGIIQLLKQIQSSGNRVYLIGNGGSAAIAGHICTDLVNVCKVSAQVLHDAPQLTCFCNDYGYSEGYSRQLEILARPKDLLIVISSSGRSENMKNAVAVAKTKDMSVFSLSGFDGDNPLRKEGDWNYWLESRLYGQLEVGHLFLLHHVCDQMSRVTSL